MITICYSPFFSGSSFLCLLLNLNLLKIKESKLKFENLKNFVTNIPTQIDVRIQISSDIAWEIGL